MYIQTLLDNITYFNIAVGKTIDLTYSADGNKLRKVGKTGATINLVQVEDPVSNEMSIGEYVNGIEYRGTAIPATTIEVAYHAEGRVYNSAGSWKREYTIKDLPIAIGMGNTRIAYCDLNNDGVITTGMATNEILQENHYDAFGYDLSGAYMNHTNADNLYQYNGKEKNDDHGIGMYDYGARWYDAGVGRWTSVDPMADKMAGWSPYNYTFNNPIKHIDPDGAFPYPVTIRSFAPPGSFRGTGFRDDGRGFSSRSDVTSRISQTYVVDPTARTIYGGQPTSDKTYLGSIGLRASDDGKARANFSNSSSGSVANVSAEFEGLNPFFLGAAPDIEVSSNVTITENNEKGTLGALINLSSKQFPATEAIIQDSKNQSVFLGGAAAYGSAASLIIAGKKQVASLNLTINTNKKGVFQSVTFGDKTYSIEEFNKTFSSKSAGPFPRNQSN